MMLSPKNLHPGLGHEGTIGATFNLLGYASVSLKCHNEEKEGAHIRYFDICISEKLFHIVGGKTK